MIQMLASTYNSRKHVTNWVYMCFHKYLQNKSCMEEPMNSIRHIEPSQLRQDMLYKILLLFFGVSSYYYMVAARANLRLGERRWNRNRYFVAKRAQN